MPTDPAPTGSRAPEGAAGRTPGRGRSGAAARSDATLWREMNEYLWDKHAPICRQWFSDLHLHRLEQGLLEIRTGTAIQRNYLQNRCLEPFTEAAQQTTGQLIAVRFVHGPPRTIEPEPEPEPTPQPAVEPAVVSLPLPRTSTDDVRKLAAERSAAAREAEEAAFAGGPTPEQLGGGAELDDGLILSPDHTFDQFVAGPNNELALALCQSVAEAPATAYNPLFIHGGVGLGKTHLLQAICLQILEARPAFKIVFVSCEKFTNQFLECVRNGRWAQFRLHYREADMLVIDDVHFLAEKERSQEEFFHTFNELHGQKKQIVLSSDAAPSEIPGLTDRLISRFNWGVVAPVGAPSYETRIAILEAKAELRGLGVPRTVLEYMARRIDTNARELEGAITTLQAHAHVAKRPIDLELARRAMGDPNVVTSGRVTLGRIVDVVCKFYSVKQSELQSKRRHKSIAEPRQVCMFIARQRTDLSLEDIGGHFGGRDHTTVMHSVQKITKKVAEDEVFAAQILKMTEDSQA
ncbi:chromosomal replication initiator protein DnaA [Phycisphaera mikurensis]|nr:chromosomal replication initiator protein DnaA [Phycisphaera mikurensis]MBB6441838.1 chromosomal replication initiator protein [Phycisphaera mikurensis]